MHGSGENAAGARPMTQPMVRTFRAPDSAAAIAAVKAALGPEAVILATRQVDGGLFRRPEVEITAALEPPRLPPPAPVSPVNAARGYAAAAATAPAAPSATP